MNVGPGIPAPTGSLHHRWKVAFVAETGSTNTDLLAAVDRGDPVDHVVLRTDHQTAGRGRLDRRWDAPPGANLLASICFTDVPDHPVELTQAVGVAAVRAIDRLTQRVEDQSRPVDAVVALKWPNDILLGDTKLAGVLAQRSARGPVVVGIGLNISFAPDDAACLVRDLGLATEPGELLDQLLIELDVHLELDRSAKRARYVDRLGTLGRTVQIQLPVGDDLVGQATEVDDTGRLVVVDSDGVDHAVDVGDIVHLRTGGIDRR